MAITLFKLVLILGMLFSLVLVSMILFIGAILLISLFFVWVISISYDALARSFQYKIPAYDPPASTGENIYSNCLPSFDTPAEVMERYVREQEEKIEFSRSTLDARIEAARIRLESKRD